MKILVGIIIFLSLLGIGSLIVPDTEDKNVQILNKYGVEVIARKKDFQKDSCTVTFDITSKNEDLFAKNFTVEIPEIDRKIIQHNFVKLQLKKDVLQREIKIFSIPCQNIGKMNIQISSYFGR